jgi:predicted phage terminase large subunit-like protein
MIHQGRCKPAASLMDREIILHRSLETDLGEFVREAWKVLEPGKEYQHNWHIDAICELLTAARKGQVTRAIINVPPRHMKSLLATVNFPCWIWTTEPSKRFLFASYSGALSTEHSLLRRNLLLSEWYQGFWRGEVQLSRSQNQKSQFANKRRGQMIATSVGGTVTGKGGDFLIVDDPISVRQSFSNTYREEAIRFFDQTLSTRLNDPARGVIIVIMHRLHQADLSAHLLSKAGWTHLCLPAEAEERESVTFALSRRVHVREVGEVLWESRFPRKVLQDQKLGMGTYAYAAQMQQRPSSVQGSIFQREWWRYWRELPAQFDTVIQSWDCTFKSAKDSDYVVGQVWGKTAPINPDEKNSAQYYLLDQVRGRMDFVSTKNAIRSVSAKYPSAIVKIIEDRANGPAVISALKSEVDGLIAVNPQGGKDSRANSISGLVEAGNVFIPDPTVAAWVHDFVEECAGFPNGAHDDQVDAMSQALLRLRMQGTGDNTGLMEFYGSQAICSQRPNFLPM